MKILIAGDFCPTYRIQTAIDKQDYSAFDNITQVTENVDYSIVNLECPIVIDGGKPIAKCGPNLKTTPNVINALQYTKFDCVTLANNHFRDFGDDGCNTTLKLLKEANIDYVGGGKNITSAQQILYKQFGNKILGIVNFCENEFSIATENHYGSAPLDPVDNYEQITEARKNSDFVLVIVHGGHEYYQLPSPRMQKLYRHFIAIGADIVVNHHQHCYSGYEYFHGKPIVYGLGNFCFDRNREYNSVWNQGYILIVDTDTFKIELVPYTQCDKEPKIKLMGKQDRDNFSANITHLNSIIRDKHLLQCEFEKWVQKQAKRKQSIFAPYFHKYLNAAANRGWIPLKLNKKNAGIMLNHIACEAHRDITIKVMLDKLNKDI